MARLGCSACSSLMTWPATLSWPSSALITLDISRQNEGVASAGTASGASSEELAACCKLELDEAPTAGDALADVNDVWGVALAFVADVALNRAWSVTGAIMISLGTATLTWRSA